MSKVYREAVEDEAIKYLIDIGYFKEKSCNKCGIVCGLKTRKRSADAANRIFSWRCPKCSSFYSLYENTAFSLFKKPFYDMLQYVKTWSLEMLYKILI